MGVPMPEDAQILHDGKFFRLGWAKETPDFVTQRDDSPFDPFAGWDAATR